MKTPLTSILFHRFRRKWHISGPGYPQNMKNIESKFRINLKYFSQHLVSTCRFMINKIWGFWKKCKKAQVLQGFLQSELKKPRKTQEKLKVIGKNPSGRQKKQEHLRKPWTFRQKTLRAQKQTGKPKKTLNFYAKKHAGTKKHRKTQQNPPYLSFLHT